MAGDAARDRSNISAAMPKATRLTPDTVSSRAEKARPQRPRVAVGASMPTQRKQASRRTGRLGVGTAGDRVSPKRDVGMIGATERTKDVTARTTGVHERTMDVHEIQTGMRGNAIRPTSVARHFSRFRRFEAPFNDQSEEPAAPCTPVTQVA